MRYGDVCTGIGAASLAWSSLGFEAAWFAEIEPFPCRVLARRWPHVRNLGDMRELERRVRAREIEAPDVLVGGTPCQSFSVAGKRASLSDDRGNLALSFVRLADAIDVVRAVDGRPACFIVWENVPGVFTVEDNAFGSFLAGLVGSDAPLNPGRSGWTRAGVASGPERCAAWRTLDAQFFGLAQRRERVFVFARGGARAWTAADALLPITESVRWYPEPSRSAREAAAGDAARGARGGSGTLRASTGGADVDHARAGHLIAAPLGSVNGGPRPDADFGALLPEIPELAWALQERDAKGSDSSTKEGHLIVVPFDTAQLTHRENRSRPEDGDPSPTLAATGHPPSIAFSVVPEGGQGADLRVAQIEIAPALTSKNEGVPGYDRGVRIVQSVAIPILEPGRRSGRSTDDPRIGIGIGADGDPMFTLNAQRPHGLATASAVRRLTPRECERLQGFPDDYTAIPDATDSPRYRALGNSMAVPVMRELGRKIAAVLEEERTP